MDTLDVEIINLIQKDFAITKKPFLDMALKLNTSEELVLKRINHLLERGILTRVGPFFNMDKSTGYVSLVAMEVPQEHFDEVAVLVNSYEEVAHNYKRGHRFNMWFVIAGRSPEEVFKILEQIEKRSGIKTYNFPKLKEFALDLFLEASL